jgi:hypothetical protein
MPRDLAPAGTHFRASSPKGKQTLHFLDIPNFSSTREFLGPRRTRRKFRPF